MKQTLISQDLDFQQSRCRINGCKCVLQFCTLGCYSFFGATVPTRLTQHVEGPSRDPNVDPNWDPTNVSKLKSSQELTFLIFILYSIETSLGFSLSRLKALMRSYYSTRSILYRKMSLQSEFHLYNGIFLTRILEEFRKMPILLMAEGIFTNSSKMVIWF